MMIMISNKKRVGIAIGQRHIAAVMISRDSSLSIIESTLDESNNNLFCRDDYSSLGRCLDSALKSVASWIGNRYVPVQVALPDPVVLSHAMHFESFPKERMRQHLLVSWQMEKTFHMQHDTLNVAYIKERVNSSSTHVFCTAIHKGLLQTINSAFSAVNIEPEAIMMAAFYGSPDREIASTNLTAHIRLNPEYASIVVLNSKGMPYFIRSFWRTATNLDSEDKTQEIIKNVYRTLHAFMVTTTELQLEKITIDADNEVERDIFKQHFLNRNNVMFVDKTSSEDSSYSSLEQVHYCYNTALDAAYI
ncbi:MAG: hypothetical protein ACH255_20360 [Candidatus Thiodiazotropha sp.]